MKNNESWNKLERFLEESLGEFEFPISRTTLIEDDLGVTGDDAYDLINSFSKKFNVDISSFRFEEYFYPEPTIFGVRDGKVKPFTVGDMERALLNGRLDS